MAKGTIMVFYMKTKYNLAKMDKLLKNFHKDRNSKKIKYMKMKPY